MFMMIFLVTWAPIVRQLRGESWGRSASDTTNTLPYRIQLYQPFGASTIKELEMIANAMLQWLHAGEFGSIWFVDEAYFSWMSSSIIKTRALWDRKSPCSCIPIIPKVLAWPIISSNGLIGPFLDKTNYCRSLSGHSAWICADIKCFAMGTSTDSCKMIPFHIERLKSFIT